MNHSDMPSYISVVLCRVRESGNVGSICRAMKTMGLRSLILADCPGYDEGTVRMMAVHAYDVFEGARRFDTLDAALGEFSLAAGFSRRRGERRKESSMPLRTFVAEMAARPAAPLAIVFGNEKDGLTDAELALCSLAVHIPSSPAFPSLNVAQAVQIACYEFFAAAGVPAEPGATIASSGEAAPSGIVPPAARGFVDAETGEIAQALAKAGFFNRSDDSHVRRFLRDLCERSGATRTEVGYLKKLFLKAAALSSRPSSRRT